MRNTPSQFTPALIRRLLKFFLVAWSVLTVGGFYQTAYADTEKIVLEIPVYGQISYDDYDDLIAQAESWVSQAIVRQFNQSTDFSAIKVVVLGRRNDDIIPILSTTVSRTQWQEKPQVGAWTHYYASYALLQHHNLEAERVASSPTTSGINAQNRAAAIDRAFDEGSLTGKAAQEFLNNLD
jgi:hypothetical protein